jgi:hypothetical protein
MSRAILERRRQAEKRWPMLHQLLGAYFCQDVFVEFETLAQARRAAVIGFDLGDQKRIATEWWDWNRAVGASSLLCEHLDAYGVELDFESDAEARQFMNEIYDALIVEIRKTDSGWKP